MEYNKEVLEIGERFDEALKGMCFNCEAINMCSKHETMCPYKKTLLELKEELMVDEQFIIECDELIKGEQQG